ncbi:MAG: hypothetical protein KC912_23150 [Proteobacteria bacterium]|nr:hypothetical protein [Pseudomonadota bacterium]
MTDGKTLFWQIAIDLLEREGVTRGTMMGFPCLRYEGTFFACVHRTGESMIIKASASRVNAMVEAGIAEPFAPNGRVFREWAAIPTEISESWPDRLEEAFAFAKNA